MPSSQMSIDLPDAMAEAVRARVASGDYASESEVVRDGLRALADRERAIGEWLRGPIAEEYAAWEAGTLATIGVAELREEFAAERTSDK